MRSGGIFRFDECRGDGIAAIDNASQHSCQLERRYEDIALTDAGDDGFSLLPRRVEFGAFPVAVGNDTGFLVFQPQVINGAKAEAPAHGGDFFDAEF